MAREGFVRYEVVDIRTGKTEIVIDQTSNSYLVTRTKLTKHGINCTNWFDELTFTKRFKINNG